MNRFLLLFFLVIAGSSVFAEDLSRIGIDARGQALGRAVCTLPGDSNAPIMNPAALMGVDALSLTSMYMKYYQDVTYVVAGASIPFQEGVLSGRWVSIRVDDIIKTYRETAPDKIKPFNPDFPDLSRIEAGGAFNYYSNMYVIGYARKLLPDLAVGVSSKFFVNKMETISSGNAHGWDMDAGLLYSPSALPVQFSAVLKNLLPGPNIVWGTGTKESLPLNVVLGAAYRPFSNLNLMSEAAWDQSPDKLWLYKLGVEWTLFSVLALRAGCYELHEKPYIKQTQYSVGAGLNMSGITFDYAFKPDLELNYNHLHFFSMGIKFN